VRTRRLRRAEDSEPQPAEGTPDARAAALLALQRSAGNRAVAGALARTRVLARSRAEDTIDAHTDMFGANLNEESLAEELAAGLPSDSDLVWEVFKLLDFEDSDDVALAISEAVPDFEDLKAKLRPNPHLARMLVICLQYGTTTDGEAAAIERFTRASSRDHNRLATEPWSDSGPVTSALGTTGAELQPNESGHGDLIFDEYSIVMDSMPDGVTPEGYLEEMSQDLNAAVNSELFDAINTFHRRPQPGNTGGPAVGDVYHIDIKGPDNGSVMLVEATPDHFVFQTVWTSEDGYHPEYGARQFGFVRLANGAVRWYTKGASRPGYTPGSGTVGRHAQESGWTRLINGIAEELQRRGGAIRSGSFQSWNTHRDDALSSGRVTL
jgi:hypothetical protein